MGARPELFGGLKLCWAKWSWPARSRCGSGTGCRIDEECGADRMCGEKK